MAKRRRKKKTGFFSRIILFLNAASVLLLVLSYLASYVDPSTFWPLAFFGLGYPLFLLLNGLFILYWLFSRPAYAMLSLLAILLGWKFFVSTFGLNSEQVVHTHPQDNIVRVMTWNVHNFRSVSPGGSDYAKDDMLAVIAREQPDILCVQEYYSKRRGAGNIRKNIEDILQSKSYYLNADFSNPWEVSGMAIFSKLNVKDTGSVTFDKPHSGNKAIFADFEVKGKRFRVYNIHLQSIRFQPEDYEYIRNVRVNNGDVISPRRIVGRLKRAFIKRSSQVKMLASHAASTPYPTIFAGDFNDTPNSYALNTLLAGKVNAFRKKGSGFGITYNGDFPNFQIDYILAAKQFAVMSYYVVSRKLSDHYPLIADIEIR